MHAPICIDFRQYWGFWRKSPRGPIVILSCVAGATMQRSLIISVFLLGIGFAFPGLAQSPASAIVEAVDAPTASVQQLDYVNPGEIIDLGTDGTLILGYLASCQRERIEGGKVTVGKEQSTVAGGTVKRLKVACDGGALQLTAAQSQQSLAIVFRDFDPSKSANLPKPQVVLYSTSPVVSVGTAGALHIRRIDSSEAPVDIVMDRGTVDLAPLGIFLTPGGLYQAKAVGRGVTFKIDLGASNSGPVLSRLLRF